MLTPASLQRVQSADIVAIISGHVALKKSGSAYTGCCPFHDEKSPSFHVNAARGIFKCFGCGQGGDVISFVRKYRKLEFIEACEVIAQLEHFELEHEGKGFDREAYQAARQESATMRDILRTAQAHFVRCLADAPAEARQHIEARGWSEEDVARWGIGYAPAGNTLTSLFRAVGLLSEAAKAGVVQEGDNGFYDFYRQRLIYPIRSITGDVVSYTARDLTGVAKAKYKNGPGSPVYNKSAALFGLYESARGIREHGFAVLVEGAADAVALHAVGITNAVAPCGTALTTEQAVQIRKHTDRITLVPDADAAGHEAAEKAAPILLRAGFEVSIFNIPAGADGAKRDAADWALEIMAAGPVEEEGAAA